MRTRFRPRTTRAIQFAGGIHDARGSPPRRSRSQRRRHVRRQNHCIHGAPGPHPTAPCAPRRAGGGHRAAAVLRAGAAARAAVAPGRHGPWRTPGDDSRRRAAGGYPCALGRGTPRLLRVVSRRRRDGGAARAAPAHGRAHDAPHRRSARVGARSRSRPRCASPTAPAACSRATTCSVAGRLLPGRGGAYVAVQRSRATAGAPSPARAPAGAAASPSASGPAARRARRAARRVRRRSRQRRATAAAPASLAVYSR